MNPVDDDDPILGYVFRASRDMGMVRWELLGEVFVTGLGLTVIAVAITLILLEELLLVLLVLIALGCAVVYMGLAGVRHTRSKLARTIVVVDIDRARELVDGRLVREIAFGPEVRVDVGVNYGSRSRFQPLYGITFVKGSERIEVCPTEGYPLNDVTRLWPLTLAIMRRHGLPPSATFRAHLRFEKTRGGYWADIHDEMLGEEERDPRGFYERYFDELRAEAEEG